MKRSEVNAILRNAERFFTDRGFLLPPWASLAPDDMKSLGPEASEIWSRGLGWDITDFGLGRFDAQGLVLFTIRNGLLQPGHKPYAEKIMLVGEGQETPFHYHWTKMEDIINRGGGVLMLDLRQPTPDGLLSDEAVEVSIDGIRRIVQAGTYIELSPGESITLPTKLFHRFWGKEEHGPVLTGEVSMVNDDASDNKFLDPIGRFPTIEEDEEPYRLLVSDYEHWLRC